MMSQPRRVVSPISHTTRDDDSSLSTNSPLRMSQVPKSNGQQQPRQHGDAGNGASAASNTTAGTSIRLIRDASQLKFSMFFDPSLPWVLVENGSLNGYFDWVPAHMRVGGWSSVALVYLTALWYAAAMTGVYLFQQKETLGSWWSNHGEGVCQAATEADPAEEPGFVNWSFNVLSRLVSVVEEEAKVESEACLQTAKHYPGPYSSEWIYNTLGFLWMSFVVYSIMYKSPMGLKAWGTYTVQSWTLLTFRHGLSSLAPFSKTAALMAEVIRFPAACSATVTFIVWNFALVPFIYLFAMDTDAKRKGFVKFCFGFRLVQIHLLNIVFCYLNIAWASPPRELHAMDLYLALLSVLTYMMFYLLVLDRIGVHLYPIFSPRLRGLVVVSWTSVIGLYALSFSGWNKVLAAKL